MMTSDTVDASDHELRVIEFLAALPAAIELNHRDATPVQVVDAIRRDLKLAVKVGLIPAHAKFSVRREDYKSIYIDLSAWHGQVLTDDYFGACVNHIVVGSSKNGAMPGAELRDGRRTRRQSQDGRVVDAINDVMYLVERLADRHNYDNSDTMTDYYDVGYYLHVSARSVIVLSERGVRQECDPAYRELLTRAGIAARRIGAKATRSICGKGGVENCSDWTLDRLIKLDEHAAGRPLVYDKQRASWVVASC